MLSATSKLLYILKVFAETAGIMRTSAPGCYEGVYPVVENLAGRPVQTTNDAESNSGKIK